MLNWILRPIQRIVHVSIAAQITFSTRLCVRLRPFSIIIERFAIIPCMLRANAAEPMNTMLLFLQQQLAHRLDRVVLICNHLVSNIILFFRSQSFLFFSFFKGTGTWDRDIKMIFFFAFLFKF